MEESGTSGGYKEHGDQVEKGEEDPGTDAPSGESRDQGQVPDKDWERNNLSTRPLLKRGGTMLDYFIPAATMGHTSSPQTISMEDTGIFGMDDRDDEWLAATPGVEMNKKKDADDSQEGSRTVMEDCQPIKNSPCTAPSSVSVDKLCEDRIVEEDICSGGNVSVCRSDNEQSDCATAMNVKNDIEEWDVQSSQKMNVQPSNSDSQQVREGGSVDECVFNNDMSRCGTHDCAVRSVKVTSIKWRWKPKQKIYGNVSTKEMKFICIGRGLEKKGPDRSCIANKPGPNTSGVGDYLRQVDRDLRLAGLKSESLLATGIENDISANNQH